jgi:hypothetical protein
MNFLDYTTPEASTPSNWIVLRVPTGETVTVEPNEYTGKTLRQLFVNASGHLGVTVQDNSLISTATGNVSLDSAPTPGSAYTLITHIAEKG